jgi:hypothetical protein
MADGVTTAIQRGIRQRVPALLLLAFFLGGCQGSGFQYISDSDTSTYFKLPEEWKIYREESSSVFTRYFVAFDGAHKPSPSHLLSPTADHPFGVAQVRILTDQQRENWSILSMRNYDLPIDQLVEQEQAEVLAEDNQVVQDGGARGVRIIYNVERDGELMTLNQTSLVDPTTRVFYQFIVGCHVECYARNQDTINEIVGSWTIKET